MRHEAIARNYAEVLFELGEQHGESERYGALLEALAAAVTATPQVLAVMMSPRVPKAAKAELLADALPDAPKPFVLFLQALVKRSRQGLLDEVAQVYTGMVDAKLNRVRVGVTLAHAADAALQQQISTSLTKALGKEALVRFAADPALLGGSVVRVGDRVHDGSLRRKMIMLRRQLLNR
ncbi:MAG TPA: ATP synthase F1 subunit delta [Gemmatimonadales bacterium]|nr:ATP synthase F1 subunit delta [Gemmatimonadales bacterium]